jgi:hypothetical protein
MASWLFIRLKDGIASFFKPKHKKLSAQQLGNDMAYNAYKASVRKEVDRLLDKISRHSIKSLTEQERKFLEANKDT